MPQSHNPHVISKWSLHHWELPSTQNKFDVDCKNSHAWIIDSPREEQVSLQANLQGTEFTLDIPRNLISVEWKYSKEKGQSFQTVNSRFLYTEVRLLSMRVQSDNHRLIQWRELERDLNFVETNAINVSIWAGTPCLLKCKSRPNFLSKMCTAGGCRRRGYPCNKFPLWTGIQGPVATRCWNWK